MSRNQPKAAKDTPAMALGAAFMASGAGMMPVVGIAGILVFAGGIGLMILGIVDATRARAAKRSSEGGAR